MNTASEVLAYLQALKDNGILINVESGNVQTVYLPEKVWKMIEVFLANQAREESTQKNPTPHQRYAPYL